MLNKITLQWRITLLTISVLFFSSIALVFFINLNVKAIMPQATETMIDGLVNIAVITTADASDVISMEPSDITTEHEPITTLPSMDTSQTAIPLTPADGNARSFTIIRGEMKNATSDILLGSIIILLIIIVISGGAVYVISCAALSPIRALNNNVKRINVTNLLNSMPLEGPNDEIKELMISFNSMLAKLDNAFSSQRRFNACVAHELKTPLAAIKINIGVMNDQDEISSSDYKQTIQIVEQSVDKMNAMIEALLDSVSEENGPLNDNIRIDEIILDVVQDLKLIAQQSNVALNHEIKTVSVTTGNEVLLYRVLYNIVENAVKYNKEAGTVTIHSEEVDHWMELQISDTGGGIAEKELENIFKPFYRVNNSNNKDGFGLGLAFAKSAIAVHGGEIIARSVLGVGMTFIIRLPIITLK